MRQWEDAHQTTFLKTNQLVSKSICLQYYDPNAEVHLEVDASIKGLCATLIQKQEPVAFASQSLTTAESSYSNIERECLAIVHGIQWFHHYLYGRSFTIISDHKPLQAILHKPLYSAPPRIMRVMTKMQGYAFKITHVSGPKLIISDTLSRMPNPSSGVHVSIDERVDEITIDECEDISIDLLNFSPAKQAKIKHLTPEIIHGGWPENNSLICQSNKNHIIIKNRENYHHS